ncbi:MAG: acyl-CoA/acyl-ACP dehydrogenase [Actinobacteria bacterium]|nr:acyl-CoA/acyl-ACP dehydrogenase [Actinomycetota bacterium]MBU1943481.1 acyl-CoA/acyl-ACP dehydrogenase [Actinomycetota bacterium]MBU2686838.1 acyl-CoA/acyl-ACP dehydrogenase [Actinomycetota bacterium]
MFVDYTEEQMMVREMAREFARAELLPLEDDYDFQVPLTNAAVKEIWGRLEPAFRRIADGFEPGDIDYVSLGILAEELFKVNPSLCCVLAISAAPAMMLHLFAPDELKEEFIGPVLAGEKIGCFAITEPDVGSNPAGVECTAVAEGDHYVVNGTKTWISNGDISDLTVLVLRVKNGDEQSIGILLVDREVSPYESRELPHLGLKAFPTSELFFTDCGVPKRNMVVGGDGAAGSSEGLKAVFRGFEVMRTIMALGSVGMAQAALDHSITYAKQRKQWGKLIGEHQMIQEMICDMSTSVDCARLLAYRALSMLQQGKRCDRETSMAKFFATEMAVEVTSKAIQIHGANGLSEEFGVERLWRDARMFTIPDGTTQMQKLIVARDLLKLSAFC